MIIAIDNIFLDLGFFLLEIFYGEDVGTNGIKVT